MNETDREQAREREGAMNEKCRNGCGREAQTTVVIFRGKFAVCYPCGARIRCIQERLGRWEWWPLRHFVVFDRPAA